VPTVKVGLVVLLATLGLVVILAVLFLGGRIEPGNPMVPASCGPPDCHSGTSP